MTMTADPTTPLFQEPRIPSECPVCGAYSLAPESNMSVLIAVCDVLVVKALEKMGNYIVRAERSRYAEMGGRSHTIAHTVWTPSESIVTKALRGAWDVVPAVLETHGGCCHYDSAEVVRQLDGYVHDLAITGTEHDLDELVYRLRERLGLPVYRVAVEQPSA